MNISTNLKAIDMIKGEILSEIAHLYRTLADYDEIGDYEGVFTVAGHAHVQALQPQVQQEGVLGGLDGPEVPHQLGRGLGDEGPALAELLGIGEENGHELEIEFSDMSELKKYLKSR